MKNNVQGWLRGILGILVFLVTQVVIGEEMPVKVSRAASTAPTTPSPSLRVSQSRVFDAPLFASRAPVAAESFALLEALEIFRQRTLRDDFSSVEGFLGSAPDSAWALSLRTILGGEYYRTGHYSKAIDAWRSAWEQGKGYTNEVAMALANEAAGELGLMYARLGRMQEVRQVL